ncbi:MAG: 4-hydroxy-3-methylbut-2-enyl diphosphate reductase [Acidobacteriota bacterium]
MTSLPVYRKGFGLSETIAPELERDYHSRLVDWFREHGPVLEGKETALILAREFGFCYGVDRAVEYAYEARRRFPERRLHITGEIIHNPHVNHNLRKMGVNFLSSPGDREIDFSPVQRGDVVILPAFGARASDMASLEDQGAILVDTTCGSVLNVWKNVRRNAQDGFTSVIHGKCHHEETRATASWATGEDGKGHYLVVRDMDETETVCRYIEQGGSPHDFLHTFKNACSPGFDPDLHLVRLGVANQTTMLSSESLAIARRLGEALAARYGSKHPQEHFRSFDTICSATQERQDAVAELLAGDPDILVVIGGYNSSNTNHLAELAHGTRTRPFHIEDAGALDHDGCIRYKPVGSRDERVETVLLPLKPLRIGITAGASTPNNRIGEVLEKILLIRNLPIPTGTMEIS